ncbi:MAG: SPOR domain-containing protein [Synergistaceae bacterium]|nr:SPOR domain-containing protein [Synergistaceae bacterium]
MTSRLSSERTPETERRPRMRRGIKKRGILPSFGDIVLPIVSVAAVGLLVLAGRQFFINGMQSSPGITSTRAYADAPALIAEREKEAKQPAPVAEVNVPEAEPEPEPEENMLAVAEVITPQPVKTANVPAKAPAVKEEPVKTAAKPAQIPLNKQWRVQIGAYSTKAAAEEAAKKVRKAGYRAVVYSNPASKHVKVWVEGGPTKFYADRMVNAMKKLGYKSSFAFPPAK